VIQTWQELGNLLMHLPGRAWGFLVRPEQAWKQLGPPPAAWYVPVLGHALPLAFLPAAAWGVGSAIYPLTDTAAADPASRSRGLPLLSGIPEAIATTVTLCLLSVALFAIAIHCLAPMYRLHRNWRGAVEVAAYGSTPVFLAGAFLFWPVLILICVAALLPCCHVVYLGLQARMGCHADDAAAYVVVAMVLVALMSMLLGAAGGALDLI